MLRMPRPKALVVGQKVRWFQRGALVRGGPYEYHRPSVEMKGVIAGLYRSSGGYGRKMASIRAYGQLHKVEVGELSADLGN